VREVVFAIGNQVGLEGLLDLIDIVDHGGAYIGRTDVAAFRIAFLRELVDAQG
jgi:hypothetical protein